MDMSLVIEAVLLYFSAPPWGEAKQARWRQITGKDDATSRALCDWLREIRDTTYGPSLTCPHCGAVSFGPHDISHRYCGRCHLFADAQPT
jgi:hypothetical protein